MGTLVTFCNNSMRQNLGLVPDSSGTLNKCWQSLPYSRRLHFNGDGEGTEKTAPGSLRRHRHLSRLLPTARLGTKDARTARGGARRSRLGCGPAPSPRGLRGAFRLFCPRLSRAVLPGLASPGPCAGPPERFRSPAAGWVLTLPALPPQAPRHCLGSLGCPRECRFASEGRRAALREGGARWEGQCGQPPVSGRGGRPRPWESLAAQTEGESAPGSPFCILIHLGPCKGHIL